ncbi:MAG: hypothetical protein LiPW15_65 [Parcubacteria group bacterium LiPW_15]|nr:MAG: hypothetical protein LiPW15_65 [Parcubacteria group bacterium LiPW_15]
MGKQKSFWLLALILIIAGGLRLYHLKELPPGLYPDEAMNGNNALEILDNGAFSARGGSAFVGKVFYPENNGREGLFMNIQALSLKFWEVLSPSENSGGENREGKPWALRFPSPIFGILTVLGLYFLGKEFFSKRVGLLAAFFLATSFWHINFSRIGFRAIMAPFFLVWALYFFLHAIRKSSDNKNSTTLIYAGVAGIFFGLGFYSYIAFRVMPLLFLVLIPFFGRHKGFWKCTAVFIGVTFLVAAPIGLYFLHNPADFMGRTTQVSIMNSPTPLKDLSLNILKTAGMFNFMGDWNWRHNFAGRPEVFWPVGIFLWMGTILTVRAVWKKFAHGEDRGYALPATLMMAWIILAVLPVVISNEGMPHALRSILFLPVVMLLAGWGANWLYEKIIHLSHISHNGDRLIKTVRACSVILFALLVLEAATTYFILWGKNPNVPNAFAADQIKLGKELLALPIETPKYVVVKAQGVDVRGIPMPSQTVMFITDTFTPAGQAKKNIHYVLSKDESSIPAGALKFYIN